MAQLGNKAGGSPFGGGGGMSAEEMGGVMYSAMVAAQASTKTVVTREQIMEVTALDENATGRGY